MLTTYGARCLAEFRRLTNSTWGWSHEQLREIEDADEAAMLSLLRQRAPDLFDAVLKDTDHRNPEALVRGLVEEGRRRAQLSISGPNPFDLVSDLVSHLIA